MKYVFTAFMAVVVLMLLGAPASADWAVGDGHKMHYPQPPDPIGWDIDMTNYVLADDWKCSETGLVDDIHFWLSVEGETSPQPPPINAIQVSIHDDVPIGPGNNYGFSYPVQDPLRQWVFDPAQFTIAGPWDGQQGWDDPQPDSDCLVDNHFMYWQVNITKISEMVPNPFRQVEGKIYWLDLTVETDGRLVGWKTTTRPFNDDAVYATPGVAPGWQPVAVCYDNMPTDFAFVITPEPGTIVMLLGAGLMGLLAYARRRRKS